MCMQRRIWKHSTPLPFPDWPDCFCCLCKLVLMKSLSLMFLPCTDTEINQVNNNGIQLSPSACSFKFNLSLQTRLREGEKNANYFWFLWGSLHLLSIFVPCYFNIPWNGLMSCLILMWQPYFQVSAPKGPRDAVSRQVYCHSLHSLFWLVYKAENDTDNNDKAVSCSKKQTVIHNSVNSSNSAVNPCLPLTMWHHFAHYQSLFIVFAIAHASLGTLEPQEISWERQKVRQCSTDEWQWLLRQRAGPLKDMSTSH